MYATIRFFTVTSDHFDQTPLEVLCRTDAIREVHADHVQQSTDADLATTMIHEYAHARLHFDVDEPDERSKREVEAEAVTYVVGRHFGLDTSNSAFYLAAWQDDDSDGIQDRLGRISRTASKLIERIETA